MELPAHVIAGHVVAVGAGQQANGLATQLRVGEPRQRVGNAVFERTVDVAAFALVGDGAIGDGALAAAVGLAEAIQMQPGGAFVEAGHGGAIIGGCNVGVVFPVEDLRGQARQAAPAGGRVEGGILDVALETPERTLVEQFHADDAAEIAALKAGGHGQAMGFTTACFGIAVAIVDDRAVERFLEDEVDHAGHRIGAVHGRGAAGEHFDSIDHAERDVADVGEIAAAIERQREVGNAAAVDQHQGVIGAEAAQIDGLCAGCGLRAGGVLLALHGAAVLAERGKHFRHRGEARCLDLGGAEHGDRCRAFDLRARNA